MFSGDSKNTECWLFHLDIRSLGIPLIAGGKFETQEPKITEACMQADLTEGFGSRLCDLIQQSMSLLEVVAYTNSIASSGNKVWRSPNKRHMTDNISGAVEPVVYSEFAVCKTAPDSTSPSSSNLTKIGSATLSLPLAVSRFTVAGIRVRTYLLLSLKISPVSPPHHFHLFYIIPPISYF